MSTSSSDEGSWMAGHHTTSSDLESTGSLLFSLPSDLSDVQTDATPPTSPTPSEGKMHTPSDILLDASRRLERISALTLQADSDSVTSTKLPKQHHYRAPSASIINDDAGYEADGDGSGYTDRDADGSSHTNAGITATTKPIRRPTFLRIDTRQHRRVASMLATWRPTSPEPSFEDKDVLRPPLPRRVKLSALPSIRLKPSTVRTTHAEIYELRRRPRAELVGLGIGFPENHPLRSRAFSMPVPRSPSSIDGCDEWEEEGCEVKVQDHAKRGEEQERQFEWLPSGLQVKSTKKPTKVRVHAPSPVRLALRPTFLQVSPSPIEYLPARTDVGIFRFDNVRDRSEVIERERYRALARERRPLLDSS